MVRSKVDEVTFNSSMLTSRKGLAAAGANKDAVISQAVDLSESTRHHAQVHHEHFDLDKHVPAVVRSLVVSDDQQKPSLPLHHVAARLMRRHERVREELLDQTILHASDNDPIFLVLTELESEEAWREPPEHVEVLLVEDDVDVTSEEGVLVDTPCLHPWTPQ